MRVLAGHFDIARGRRSAPLVVNSGPGLACNAMLAGGSPLVRANAEQPGEAARAAKKSRVGKVWVS